MLGSLLGRLPAAIFVVAAAVLVPASTTAFAAPFNWSGWYVTASVGGGWRAQNSYPDAAYYSALGAYFTTGGIYGGSSGPGTPRFGGPAAAAGFGYNYQIGGVIIGAEYEFLYADLQTNPTSSTTSFTKGLGILAPGFIITNIDTVNGDSNRWYGIARVRLGTPVLDRGFIYVSGGAAYRLSYQSQDPVVTMIPYLAPTTTTTLSGFNKTHPWGWVAGFGFEYAATNDLFVRAEWLHMDFGQDTYIDPIATALVGTPQFLRYDRNADIFRFGLVYRFAGGGY